MKRAGMDSNGNFIHDDARVHDSVQMGWGNIIGPRVIIGEGTKIGHRNIFESDVVIGADVEIKSNVELRAFTVISDGCEVDSGVKSSGHNFVGPDTILRYDAIIARGCKIGGACYICPQVMTNNLDHEFNSVGGAEVGDRSFIGTATVLGAGITIAEDTLIGSCSNVTKSIEASGHRWFGNPAKDRGERTDMDHLTDRDEFNPPSGQPRSVIVESATAATVVMDADASPGASEIDTDSSMSGGGEEG